MKMASPVILFYLSQWMRLIFSGCRSRKVNRNFVALIIYIKPSANHKKKPLTFAKSTKFFKSRPLREFVVLKIGQINVCLALVVRT